MTIEKEELFKNLAAAVVDMDEDLVIELVNKSLSEKIDPYEIIDKGLSKGMERAGELFEEEEYFVPELLMCSDAMNAGIDIVKPLLLAGKKQEKGKVVIGVVEGDTHDIGKNLVKLMLETAGFSVYDLGRDVPPQQFVDKAKEYKAEIIGISTLMTTTMDGMGEVIKILNEEGVRDQYKVMVGGAPISLGFAKKIGAEGYAKNAAEAVRVAKELLGIAV